MRFSSGRCRHQETWAGRWGRDVFSWVLRLGQQLSVCRRTVLLSPGSVLSVLWGTCRRTPSPLIPVLVGNSSPCGVALASFLHPSPRLGPGGPSNLRVQHPPESTRSADRPFLCWELLLICKEMAAPLSSMTLHLNRNICHVRILWLFLSSPLPGPVAY